MCLTEEGELLWWQGKDSADTVHFRYPRGLALGKIQTADLGPIDCLAVCDSWNDRVVFLNHEGSQIDEWKTAGGRSFREVSDIRYIDNSEYAEDMPESLKKLAPPGSKQS